MRKEIKTNNPPAENLDDQILSNKSLPISDEIFRTLFEESNNVIIFVNTIGKIININSAAEEMVGYTRDELIGKNFTKLNILHFKDIPSLLKKFKDSVLAGRVIDENYKNANVMELEITGNDGKAKQISVSTSAIRKDNRLLGFLSVISDITERKKIEEDLKNNKERFELAVKGSKDGIWDWDNLESDTYWWSDRVYEIFGYKPGEIEPKISTWEALMHPDDKDRVLKVLQDHFNEGSPYEVEFRLKKKSGEYTWFFAKGESVRDKDGKPVRMAGSVSDINDKKKAQDELRESEVKFRSLFNQATDSIFLMSLADGDLIIEDVNEAALDIHGYTREELIGKPMSFLDDPESAKLIPERVKQLLNSGKPVNFKVRHIRKNGETFPVDVSAQTIHIGKRPYLLAVDRDITGRKKEEEQIRESHNRLLMILDGIEALIYVTDMETYELLFINKYGRDVWGDIQGKICWQELQAGQTGPCEFCTNKYLLDPEGRPAETYTWEFQNTGNKHWYYIQDRAIRWVDRPVVRMEIAIDITDRKKADALLRESEERFMGAFESAAIGIGLVSPEGHWLKVNPALCNIVGYSEEELLSLTFQDITYAEDLEADLKYVHQMLAGEIQNYHMEKRYIHKKGHIIWILLSVSLVKDKDGNPLYFVSQIQDITNRKNSEFALGESEKKYRRFFTTVPNAWAYHKIIVDENGKPVDYIFLEVNEAFEKQTGLKADNIIGRRVTEVLPGTENDPADWIGKYGEVALTGKEIRFENYSEIIRKWFSITASCPEKGYFITVFDDITERKKVEEERERLNKELEQVIYATSHDLRSPLVNISGYSKELKYSFEDLEAVLKELNIPSDKMDKIASIIEEDISESMKYITSSIRKMDSLLSGLVKLSRSGSVELIITDCDMNRIVADVLNAMEYQLVLAGAKCEVSELSSCRGDEKQLNQLFSNLIGNAVKYLDPERTGIIKVNGKKKKNLSVYCVEDNGIGIEHENLIRIFDLFHQISPDGEGEGIGLSIVKKIIDRLGGDIWIESEPGKGSKFYVSLPS